MLDTIKCSDQARQQLLDEQKRRANEAERRRYCLSFNDEAAASVPAPGCPLPGNFAVPKSMAIGALGTLACSVAITTALSSGLHQPWSATLLGVITGGLAASVAQQVINSASCDAKGGVIPAKFRMSWWIPMAQFALIGLVSAAGASLFGAHVTFVSWVGPGLVAAVQSLLVCSMCEGKTRTLAALAEHVADEQARSNRMAAMLQKINDLEVAADNSRSVSSTKEPSRNVENNVLDLVRPQSSGGE